MRQNKMSGMIALLARFKLWTFSWFPLQKKCEITQSYADRDRELR